MLCKDLAKSYTTSIYAQNIWELNLSARYKFYRITHFEILADCSSGSGSRARFCHKTRSHAKLSSRHDCFLFGRKRSDYFRHLVDTRKTSKGEEIDWHFIIPTWVACNHFWHSSVGRSHFGIMVWGIQEHGIWVIRLHPVAFLFFPGSFADSRFSSDLYRPQPHKESNLVKKEYRHKLFP